MKMRVFTDNGVLEFEGTVDELLTQYDSLYGSLEICELTRRRHVWRLTNNNVWRCDCGKILSDKKSQKRG